MSDKPSSSAAAESSASASSNASTSNAAASSTAEAAAKKPPPAQNPALKMMGLPRFRLPSRNWMIFWTLTGSIAGAIYYDRWQTRRTCEKWCSMVSHLADEHLPTTTLPRKVTIYLAAPPGDGLRSAREHFYTYVKPILVAAAMDWDVVEGRKEGDVRHKTAEKIRKRRKRSGEGKPLTAEEEEGYAVEEIREKNGHVDYPDIAGNIVIGRHTWKEYIRGLHEGYLGPVDIPKELEEEEATNASTSTPSTGEASPGSATVKADIGVTSPVSSLDSLVPASSDADSSTSDGQEETPVEKDGADEAKAEEKQKEEEKKKEEEKPKRRFPPSYILPESYHSATLSSSTPEIIGPSAEVRFPHLLGIRNTPTRIYRFMTRRRLADDVGRQVASAILASHRPYGTVAAVDENSATDTVIDVPEQREVLAFEEKDWYKSVHEPRKEHEESIWVEPMVIDERISSRMRVFQLTAEESERAKRIQAGLEKPKTKAEDES